MQYRTCASFGPVIAAGAVIGVLMLAGCSTGGVAAHAPSDAGAGGLIPPIPALPAGPRTAGTLQGQPPEPIDLTADGVAVWNSATATIIDTRRFDPQIQVLEPFKGEPDRVKNYLPPHGRDAAIPRGEPFAFDVGGVRPVDRIVPGADFPGISQTPWVPPDQSLAVGPDHIVSTVNMSIAFYQKDGTLDFSSRLDSTGSPGFFEGVGGRDFTFDPKCFYDQFSGRFFVLALEVYDNPGQGEAWITVAVSDDSDPNGIWYKYRTWAVTSVDTSRYWVDYPGIGFDGQAFYVTGNLFLLSGPGDGFAGVLYRTFDKTPMLSGDPVTFADIRGASSASVQVAQSFGTPPGTYFLSVRNSTSLRIQTIESPLTSPTLRTAVLGVPAISSPDDAPSPGGGLISTLDGRIMNVQWRDGMIYAAHGIQVSGKAQARWYQIDTRGWPAGPSPALVQSGNVDAGPGVYTFFPAIASNRFGNVAMVMAASSASEFASVQATGRLRTDPPGTMGSPTQLTIGSRGADGRWGDYFYIALDPNDDTTFWMIGQVQEPFGWQTWIQSFTVGCPADVNGDGSIDVGDFFAFVVLFSTGDPAADFDGDGTLDVLDFFAFVSAFAQGCG